MKRLITILTAFLLLTALCGCSGTDPVIDSLPVYESEVKYTRGEFQDYTDYAEYTYDTVSVQTLEASAYFEGVTAADVDDILKYIENFEAWVDTANDELKSHYDFNKATVSEGNYFYIKTTGDSSDNYTVYYFDINTQTLYYFHNNI